MKTFAASRWCRELLLALAGLVAIFALAGCETTEQNSDTQSDIPWNQPQPWEGAPGIPGLSQ